MCVPSTSDQLCLTRDFAPQRRFLNEMKKITIRPNSHIYLESKFHDVVFDIKLINNENTRSRIGASPCIARIWQRCFTDCFLSHVRVWVSICKFTLIMSKYVGLTLLWKVQHSALERQIEREIKKLSQILKAGKVYMLGLRIFLRAFCPLKTFWEGTRRKWSQVSDKNRSEDKRNDSFLHINEA